MNTPCAYQAPGKGLTAAQPQNGCLRQSKERLLARPTVLAAAGDRLSYAYDTRTGAFTLAATAAPGNRLATQVLVPKEVTGAINRSATSNPDGSRTVSFVPAGAYNLRIAAAPLRLTGC